jgi:L-alanine-DL-glutamate epimerase-like enolase superfamily enzyme
LPTVDEDRHEAKLDGGDILHELGMTLAPRLRLVEAQFFERQVRLRLPFRFGAATLREAPQLFVRARVAFGEVESEGVAADMLAPKWFDKSPELTNEENFDQLRRSLAMARDSLIAAGTDTAYGLSAAVDRPHHAVCAQVGLNELTASFGLALIDRAIIDALGRRNGEDIFSLARANRFGLTAAAAPDLEGFALPAFLSRLRRAGSIAARHTVGLTDALTAGDLDPPRRLNDGLPETLEEVLAAYGNRYFKLKLSGQVGADVERLMRIADVLDRRLKRYTVTLDGNEQYESVDDVIELWRRIAEEKRLARLKASILFVEQPISRAHALTTPVHAIAREVPLEVDESDANIDTFPRAIALGYRGISSKSCKGFYRSLLNCARVAQHAAVGGRAACFMSAEDLTTQAGVAVQQDLALAALIGATHVERNGHHYVDGMTGAPAHEQDAFLERHADLYHRAPHGRPRLTIRGGAIALASLDTPGLGVGPFPDFSAMTPSPPPIPQPANLQARR